MKNTVEEKTIRFSDKYDLKLNKIFEEILSIREDLESIKIEVYTDKLKKEVEDLEAHLDYNKEQISRLQSTDLYGIKEEKRMEFYN